MGAQIAVRKVTTAGRNLAHLRKAARADADASARRVAVALGAYEFDTEKMSARAAVAQQQRRVAVVGDDDVHIAVVVEIGERSPASRVRRRETVARRFGHFDEFARAVVAEELIDLFVADGRGQFDLRVDVAVGDEEVEPTVVVEIEETAAEAKDVFGSLTHADLIADLFQ